jgi:hypothetical protein
MLIIAAMIVFAVSGLLQAGPAGGGTLSADFVVREPASLLLIVTGLIAVALFSQTIH